MVAIPRDRAPDSTLAFALAGYRFISARCERLGTDLFETRLLLRRTICLRGREAAELFYDDNRFKRHRAAPRRAQKTLLGVGGVQNLDGDPHRRRKRMLMSVMTPDNIRRLTERFDAEWQARLDPWERTDRVILYEEMGGILARAVCGWAGVPLPERDVRRRTDDFHAMIEGPAAVGPRHLRGRRARARAERWIAGLVRQVREGRLATPPGSALRLIAEHRDHRGRLLNRRVAAVAVLNILRPTVAVDRFITFTALALHQHPGWRERVTRDDESAHLFVQEVRRFYPFFPAVGARVRRSFDWNGYHFPRRRRVVLDLYGTDHHPDLWPEPEQFRPERFRDWAGDAFSFIPQGGGDHYDGHRCAGEWITIELMKAALAALTRSMRYDVPAQDLSVSLRRMPALPRSGFAIADVRRTS